MAKYNPKHLDKDEEHLMQDIETVDTTKLKKPSQAEQRKLRNAAQKHLETEAKMNIRINRNELEQIKAYASREGLKYQTFIKSVLHKYITGQLIEKK